MGPGICSHFFVSSLARRLLEAWNRVLSVVGAKEWEYVELQTTTRCFTLVLYKNNGFRWQKVLPVSLISALLPPFLLCTVCLKCWAALLPRFGLRGDVEGSISWRWGVGALPAKSLPGWGVGTCIPGQRGHSLTVLFISVMQEMHHVPHLKGKSKDTEVLLTAFLYSAVYM